MTSRKTEQRLPAITRCMLAFCLVVLIGGVLSMHFIAHDASASDIATLITGVVGILGTHLGHVWGAGVSRTAHISGTSDAQDSGKAV